MHSSPRPARPRATAGARRAEFTLALGSDQLLLAGSLYFALVANRPFLAAVLRAQDVHGAAAAGLALALVAMLAALHHLLLAPLAHRRVLRPLLALLVLASALASYYIAHWGVYLDPSMVRNVLRTDAAEARELLDWPLAAHLLVVAAPALALLWRVRLVQRPWPRALALRLAGMVLALLVLVGSVWSVFQPMASLMRNHRELRYRVTPANLVWSAGTVLVGQTRAAAGPRKPIGEDAQPGPAARARAAAQQPPLLVVLVVGETARAANWGLSGYGRDTTPQLRALADPQAHPGTLLSWPHASACGTNTETSVPCLFAPVGRRDYDEARIRGSESLLHVLARAGVAVHWRDNQSGCKGVCDGLSADDVASYSPPGLCHDGHCLDEGLLAGLDERLAALRRQGGTQLLVLHMLGNHGPAYHRRYPAAFARFTPACAHDDLHQCSRDEIVNAYDNALLYTDHVLATLVARLQRAQGVDAAMLYVSDHGESLGENGLYLHGLPWAIAPSEQTRVPMLAWMAPRVAAGYDAGCLQRQAREPAAHDQVFHTLLGLVDVHTRVHEPTLDLFARCRREATP
jgi:lipid A ethanolaminephosphotransferase